MAEKITLRPLTAAERVEIERLARSRKGEARRTERAQIIQLASQGYGTSAIARRPSSKAKSLCPRAASIMARTQSVGP